MKNAWSLVCAVCGSEYHGSTVRYRCDCGGVLDVRHDFENRLESLDFSHFDQRLMSKLPWDKSGVWRFRELILPVPEADIVTRPEGNTNHYRHPQLNRFTGVENVILKHEGENPTCSFKDRGMTVGMTAAKMLGFDRVAVASTGNTSASAAAYAALSGMHAYVFIPDGQIAFGKLSQALAYGAKTIQIAGDFDDAMRLVEAVCNRRDIYLLNSVNPFRIEGQKAIAFEILQDLDWELPDWIVLPGGNLGNSSAVGKGLQELKALGLIQKTPRLAVVQAAGASPLVRAWSSDQILHPVEAKTLATAIKIGNPVSFPKCLRALSESDGVAVAVSDEMILHAKALVDGCGIGAEPASCATVAGIRMLKETGVIKKTDSVVGVLTGHVLKDPEVVVDYHLHAKVGTISAKSANPPLKVAADIPSIESALFPEG